MAGLPVINRRGRGDEFTSAKAASGIAAALAAVAARAKNSQPLQSSFSLCVRLMLRRWAERPLSGNDHFRRARRGGGPRRARTTAMPSNPVS
jgi:hypothetical protein